MTDRAHVTSPSNSAFSQNYIALRIYWILWNFRLYLAFDRSMFLNREPSFTPLRLHKVDIVLFVWKLGLHYFHSILSLFSSRSHRGSSAFTKGSQWGVNKAVCVRYLAQDMANSNSSIIGNYDCYTTDSAQCCWDLCPSSANRDAPAVLYPWQFNSLQHQPSALESHKGTQMIVGESWSCGCREKIRPSKD